MAILCRYSSEPKISRKVMICNVDNVTGHEMKFTVNEWNLPQIGLVAWMDYNLDCESCRSSVPQDLQL